MGLSAPLQNGVGFLDPLIAASPGPALRLACLGTAQAGVTLLRLFHVPQLSQDGLGPLSTPAALVFASGYVREPDPDRLPFGSSLNQPRVARLIVTMLRSVHSFDHTVRF